MSAKLATELLLCSAFLSLLGSIQSDDCAPSCEGKDPGDTVQDPLDCHNYYGCLDDGTATDTPFTCNDGYYYNPSYGSCSTEFDPCESKCRKSSCSLTCLEESVFLVYPGDCTKYRVCTPDGNLVTAQCSYDLPYFDGVQCQTDPDQCCDACEVTCTYPGTEMVDPYNCQNFYFCDTYSNYVQGSCGINMHFDPIEAQCVSGRECEDTCPIFQTTSAFSTTESTAIPTAPTDTRI